MRRGLRARVHAELYPPDGRRGLTLVNASLIALILAAVAVAVLETEPAIAGGRDGLFRGAELLFLTVFGAEYLARIWTAPESPAFAGRWGRLRYALTPSALIDFVALLPALMLVGGGSAYLLRLVRLLRILRLAKLGRFSRAGSLVMEAISSRRYELLVTVGFGAAALLVSATLMHLVEGGAQPDKFGSIPRALWWSIVTLTTIGYGDVFPVTPLGKLLAGCTAVVGIALIAAPTGILAAAFSEACGKRSVEAD